MTLALAVDLLRRLVAFDTTSSKSNRELIRFVSRYLEELGVEAHLVVNEDGDKAGLFARIGPEVEGGVVLSGHTDVVPVAGQAWTSDPFAVVERDGRLYGRGTADMKGFLAAALATVPEFRARRLKVPIHLALSYDEEIGCLGARPLIDRLLASSPKPALAIVGEPSEMRVAHTHRGIHAFVTTVTGRTGHSSVPEAGVNAIAAAAACVVELDRIAAGLAGSGGDSVVAGPTTLNVGTIEGGSAVNMIPACCRFAWECRPAPGASVGAIAARLNAFVESELLTRMRAVAPEASIRTEKTVAVPPLVPEFESPAEALALALTGQDTGVSVPFASEAGLFQRAGVPAVVLGPGSPAQAHRPDEFVAIEQIEACLAFLRRLADWAERG